MLKIIKASGLDRYRIRDDVWLVDIRNRTEYWTYHIEGSINVPQEELPHFFRKHGKRKLYILCCERGITSVHEGKYYAAEGYQVATLAGGINAYKRWEKERAAD